MVVGRIGEWRNKWEKKMLQQEIVCLPFLEQIYFFKCTMRFENWRTNGFFWYENYGEEKEKSEAKRRKI